MGRLRSNATARPAVAFLHLKFLEGRPPEFAARHPFAHELALAPDSIKLPEGLRTDVQREGIARYLQNNFKEGSPVHGYVHEREQDSSYIAVNSNWHRSSGDGKLHLSLYIYKEDRHVDTWHAYTDRSLSLERSESATASPVPRSASETISEGQSAPGYTPKPSRVEGTREDRRSFRPAAEPTEKPDSRTARPTAPSESEDESDDQELKIPPVPPSPDVHRGSAHSPDPVPSASSHSSRRHSRVGSRPRSPASPVDEELEGEMLHQPLVGTSANPDRASMKSRSTGPVSDEERKETVRSDQHKIVPSRPIGKAPSSRHRSPSPSPSPSPPRSTRSRKQRDPSPEPSPSPPPASRKERSSSPPPPRAERGRQSRSSVRQASSSRSRSPPKPQSVLKRSPSPEAKPRHRASRSRRTSPTHSSSPPAPRQRSQSPEHSPPRRPASRIRRAVEKEEKAVEEEVRKAERKVRRRSRSRSRSPSPAARPTSRARQVIEEVEKEIRSCPRSRSHSPSPHRQEASPTRSERRTKSKTRSRAASPVEESSHCSGPRRHRSPSPPESALPKATRSRPPSPSPSPPPERERTLKHQPSWRSVRRSPYPKDDSEDEVRGNLDDPSLDIPRGGEARELASARRGSRKPEKDESFDPDEVEERERRKQEPAPAASTAAAVSGWFKGVGDFIKAKTAGVSVEVDLEVDEQEEEARRKARRERRRKRREAEAQATDAELTEVEEPRRSDRKRREEEVEVEKAPKRSSRRRLEEEAAEEDHPPFSRRSRSRPSSPVEEDRSTRRRRPSTSRRSSPDAGASRRGRDESPPSARREDRGHEERSPDSHSPTSRSRRRRRSPVEEPASPTAEPPRPIRQRALSISASVGAGIAGLRETVSKAVAARAETTENAVEEDRPRLDEEDRRGTISDRRARRSDSPEPEKRSDRPSRRRAESEAGSDAEDRSTRSRRRPPFVAVTDGEESDAHSRSSRRKQKPRSDSEGDTPAHRLAKLNAAGNSTTISLDTLANRQLHVSPVSPSSQHPRSVREELRLKKAAESAARLSSAAPTPSSLRPSKPSRTERILHDIERAVERVAERAESSELERKGREAPSMRTRSRATRYSSTEDEDGPRLLPSAGASRSTRDAPPSSSRYSSSVDMPGDAAEENRRPASRAARSVRSATSSRHPSTRGEPPSPAYEYHRPRQSPLTSSSPIPPTPAAASVRPPSRSAVLIRPDLQGPHLSARSSKAASVRTGAYSESETTLSDDNEIERRRTARREIPSALGTRSRPDPRPAYRPPSSHSSSATARRPFESYSALSSDDDSDSPPPTRRTPQPFPLNSIPAARKSFEEPAATYHEEGTFDSDTSVDQRRRERVQSFSRSAPTFEPFSDGEGLGGADDGYAASSRSMVVSSDSEEEPPAREPPAPRQRTVVSSISAPPPRYPSSAKGSSRSGGTGRLRTEVSSPSPTSEFGASGFRDFGGFSRDERRERRENQSSRRR